MSQKAVVSGFKLVGTPYTGTDENGAPTYLTDATATARWLAHTSRVRFNQQRSLRSKYIYDNNVRRLDEHGKPVLAPLGSTVIDLRNGAAKAAYPFMAAMPSMVLEYQVRDENTSWFAATKRRKTNVANGLPAGSMPRFKSKHHTALSFGCFTRNGSQQVLTFTKTGRRSAVVSLNGFNPSHTVTTDHPRKWTLKIRVRIPKNMVVADFTSIRVNLDTMRLVFTSAPQAITRTSTGKSAGIDVGVKSTVATSDGVLHAPVSTKDLEARHKNLQRRMARKRVHATAQGTDWKRSRRYQKVKAEDQRVQARITRIRNDRRHKITTELVKTYDWIAVEDLKLRSMTHSAKGTVQRPGKNVAAKRGLNRVLADAGLGIVLSMMKYKSRASGVHVVEVDPAYTSQRCNACGHIGKGNRESQAVFLCQECGHGQHADVNAARNIRDRGKELWGGTRPKQVRTRKPAIGSPVAAVAV